MNGYFDSNDETAQKVTMKQRKIKTFYEYQKPHVSGSWGSEIPSSLEEDGNIDDV